MSFQAKMQGRAGRAVRGSIAHWPKTEYHKDFPSMHAVIDWCDTMPDWEAAHGFEAQSKTGTREFTGTADWKEAVDLALYGWPKGGARIRHYAQSFFEDISSKIAQSDFVRGIEPGVGIDIGAYCAGEPEVWIQEHVRHVDGVGNRVLSVAYNISADVSVPRSVITQRGALAVAMVQALETAGFSVELSVVSGAGVLCGKPKHAFHFDYAIRVKDSDQPINVDRVAFAIMHPSMLRRIGFAITERMMAPDRFASNMYSQGYGTPANLTWKDYRGDVYLGPMYGDGNGWRDEAYCVRTMFARMKEAGVNLSELDE